MKNNNLGFARIAMLIAVAAMSLGTTFLVRPAMAHDAECPYCKLKLKPATKDMDYEVVVKVGNKRVEYRCVSCVFADAKRYKSDLTVYAPSETKGESVTLKRTGTKWSAPEGTVFLNSFTKHDDCAELSRAFTSKAALDKYANAKGIRDAKALPIDDFVKLVTKKSNA